MVLFILILTTDSWVEPLLVLAGLGAAILINNGTNLMFGTPETVIEKLKLYEALGVDAFIRLFPSPLLRAFALFGALCVLLYGVILISSGWLAVFGADARGGAVDYWSKMFKIGIGLDDLRYPEWMQETFGIQERVQRWIAYLILPVGLALLSYRSLQAMMQIWRGERELIIAGHEAEDLVAENKDVLKD